MLRPTTPATCVLGPSLFVQFIVYFCYYTVIAVIELAVIIIKTDYELS